MSYHSKTYLKFCRKHKQKRGRKKTFYPFAPNQPISRVGMNNEHFQLSMINTAEWHVYRFLEARCCLDFMTTLSWFHGYINRYIVIIIIAIVKIRVKPCQSLRKVKEEIRRKLSGPTNFLIVCFHSMFQCPFVLIYLLAVIYVNSLTFTNKLTTI